MGSTLRVLYVEDSQDDVQLLSQRLTAGGYHVSYERVDNADALRSALHRRGWDLVIADYSLQRFHSSEALTIALELAPEVPFLVISGVMGEEVALECINAGAADYLTKQNILRLLPVVARVLRDAAERRTMRKAEADLRAQRSLLGMIYDNTADSLVLYTWDAGTAHWRLLSLNRAALVQLSAIGLSIQERELLGHTWEEVVQRVADPGSDTTPIVNTFYRAAETGRTTSIEQLICVGGKEWHFELTFVLFYGPDGQSRYILSIIREITARKHAEAEQRQFQERRAEAQKMEALGQLAGGVAHDFNNILTAILGFSDVIHRADTSAIVHDHATEIVRAARRAKELVRQILMFSRRQPLEQKPVALNEVVVEAVQLLRGIAPTIRFDVRLPEQPSYVHGDATQLHQVLMNLGSNAIHAIGASNGLISIAVMPEHSDRVRLILSDNGPGMSPDILDRLFEPFFTTKAPGQGSGLGLSVVHGIVQSHGGVIDVRSLEGEGTTFEILFPAIPAPVATPQPKMGEHSMTATATPTAGTRILFVDDETSITRLVQIMLKTLKHLPTTFDKPDDALAHFRVNAHNYDLIITDLTMPGMTGVDFARGVRTVRTDIPIILSSGFPDEVTEEMMRELGIVEVLPKPFQMQALGEAIARQQR